jgi:phospholipid/cholesterol/gamma-HCH transport system ATP-binding protein
MLKIEHLKKRFGAQVVLDDITFEVNKGQIVCVIGESGGGKSVILRHIIGLILPDGGRIVYNDREIVNPASKPADLAEARKRFGMLFQQAALFDSKDVGENLAFPLREHTTLTETEIQDTITDALEKVGLQKAFAAKMPSELSGGMRSRVGLARALVMKPEVMLYDEPTSALDPIMTDKINDLIISLRDKLGMTSIVVTHDISSAYKIADKISMIYQGRIIFDGAPADLRASRNPYIQQFIRSQRKHFYAVEEELDYQQAVDIRSLRLRTMHDRRARTQGSAQQAPDIDALTGLPGRTSFDTALSEELAKSASAGTNMAVIAAAPDNLDRIKIELGEGFARTVISEIAKRFEATIRGTDFAAYLGEGVVVMALARVDTASIARGVERIRQTACDVVIKTPAGQDFKPGASCGIVLSSPDGGAQAMLRNCMAALAAAQRQGGGRTIQA